MKIGIVCADAARYRRIARALRLGNFTKITPRNGGASLDVVLTDGETVGPVATHPCVFTRGSGGELTVQCGRYSEMQQRADAGIPSRNTMTMIFQDNSGPTEAAAPRAASPGSAARRPCSST